MVLLQDTPHSEHASQKRRSQPKQPRDPQIEKSKREKVPGGASQKEPNGTAKPRTGPTSFAAASAARTIKTPIPLKLKIPRKPSLTSAVVNEDDEEETHPAIEEQFLLRLPKGEMCNNFREAVKSRAVPEDTAFIFKSDRGAVFSFNGEKHEAKLVDLPTIIESHKTLDNKLLYKVADICQMLIVQPALLTDDTLLSEKSIDVAFPDGITPPLKNVRKRRFRKRVSKKTIEVVEREVERLLQEDAGVEEVKFEIQDFTENGASDSEMGTPVLNKDDFDEENFFNEAGSNVLDDEDSDFDMDLADVAAEIEREMAGSKQGNNEDEDNEEDEEEDDDDDEEDDEDGEGEGSLKDDDSNMETVESTPTLSHRKAGLINEISELEFAIERKMSDLANATNAIIKKRFGDVIEKMKEELESKRKELAGI